jgi:hypothetical protein
MPVRKSQVASGILEAAPRASLGFAGERRPDRGDEVQDDVMMCAVRAVQGAASRPRKHSWTSLNVEPSQRRLVHAWQLERVLTLFRQRLVSVRTGFAFENYSLPRQVARARLSARACNEQEIWPTSRKLQVRLTFDKNAMRPTCFVLSMCHAVG